MASDVDANENPSDTCGGLARQQAELLISVIRFAVALAKSQDHQSYLRGFLLLGGCAMRYVGGCIWDTLLHEQTKAGMVGEE